MHSTAGAEERGKRQLSLGKSAQLVGMDRLSFIDVLKNEGYLFLITTTKR